VSFEQRKSYEKLQNTHEPIPSGLFIGTKVIEEWLDETLNNVDDLNITKKILKTDKKKIINQYGIDRHTLSNAGIPEDVVHRIYRCLFVYSTGFHQLLTKLLGHTEGKYRIIKSIWRTFVVLLEYCWKTDYDSLLSDIEREYKEQQEKTEHKYISKINILENDKANLIEAIEKMEQHSKDLEREAFNQRMNRE